MKPFARFSLAGAVFALGAAFAEPAPLKVLVSGAEGTSGAAAYFPRVAKEMGFALELVDAGGDLERAVARERPGAVVLGEAEATSELVARIRGLSPKTVLHVQEGWTFARPRAGLLARAKAENLVVVPVGEAVRLYRDTDEGRSVDPAPGGVMNDEGLYLLGCVYLATMFPADMIQLIWWPAGIPCARAERMRIVAEKAAVGESARRAEDAPQAEKAKCVVWEQLTSAPAPGVVIGRLAVRDSKEIPSSRWSVGCETMDRGYAEFRNFRRYVGGTGAKHARLQSGWEKTEKVRGQYDFAWLDEHVRGLAEEGVKPWVCLCYGNPIYNSSQRMRWAVARITEDPEGFPAWVRYVEEVVKRYGDVVDTWEIWNEPFFKQVPYYAKLVKASCEAILRHQPGARIWVSAPGKYENCELLVPALKANGAVDMVEGWVYHPYVKNPDAGHDDHFDWGTVNQARLRALVGALGPRHYVVQGETGCPAQLEFSHALNNMPWTECSQAKWNLRSMVRAAANEVRLYSVFSMVDFQYTNFMLQSFGLLRADLAREVVYRRPLYYACRNVFSFFDDTVKGEGVVPCSCRIVEWADANERGRQREFTAAKFSRGGLPVVALWQSDRIPGDSRGFDRAAVAVPGVAFGDPVWVDLVTGRVCELAGLDRVPVWDAPVLMAERAAIPLAPPGR